MRFSSRFSRAGHAPEDWWAWLELRRILERQGRAQILVRTVLGTGTAVPASVATRWLETWRAAIVNLSGDTPELQLPLRLMIAATELLRTGARESLLSLPKQERTLLDPWADRYLRSVGRLNDTVERSVDAMIERLREQEKERRAKVGRDQVGHRPNLAPPPRIDGARAAALLEACTVKRKPADAFRPFLGGDWSPVAKADIQGLFEAHANSNVAFAHQLARADLRVIRVDRRSLCVSGWQLYQCHVTLGARAGCLDFCIKDDRVTVLDGTSASLSVLLPAERASLDEAATREYMTLFCSALRADEGRFEVIDSPKHPLVPAIRKKARRLELSSGDATVEVKGVRARVLDLVYGDRLFRAKLAFNTTSGSVDMLEDEPLVGNLAIRHEAYDGPLRLWAPPEEERASGNDTAQNE